jgi:hypothetical protein
MGLASGAGRRARRPSMCMRYRRGVACAVCSPLDQEDREALRGDPPCWVDFGGGALRSGAGPHLEYVVGVRSEGGVRGPQDLRSLERDSGRGDLPRCSGTGADRAAILVVRPLRGRLVRTSTRCRSALPFPPARRALATGHRVVRAALAGLEEVRMGDVEERQDDQDGGCKPSHHRKAYSRCGCPQGPPLAGTHAHPTVFPAIPWDRALEGGRGLRAAGPT